MMRLWIALGRSNPMLVNAVPISGEMPSPSKAEGLATAAANGLATAAAILRVAMRVRRAASVQRKGNQLGGHSLSQTQKSAKKQKKTPKGQALKQEAGVKNSLA